MDGMDRSSIEKRLNLLERENERLEREVRFQNLVLFGLAEKPAESSSLLRRAVTEILAETCKRHIVFDSVYRLGTHGDIITRPVRIRFMSHAARNVVFEMRRELPAGLSLKGDLPFTTRRDYSILRSKRAQLSGSGIRSVVDWKRKNIYAENGFNYGVRNGKLVEVFEGEGCSYPD